MPLGVGEVFAGYTVVRMLGSGGMGEVYLVKHPRLPRQDALKVLPASISDDAEFRNRFEREADLAATLWHPQIVGVHDRGEFEGRLWISMDYVGGSDAAKLCREQYPQGMPVDEVVDVVLSVAEALDHAHEQQLLHRDVKPGNILITDGPREKRRILLTDFGIARYADDTSGLTATNITVGSVYYSAPEQLTGDEVDGRADQYSLAATAYHLLTGSPPFAHTNSAVVISGHLSKPPPRASEAHPELAPLDDVLTKAMAKDPADRYASCVAFAAALRENARTLVADRSAVAMAPPVSEPVRPTPDEAPTQHIAIAPKQPSRTDHTAPPVTVSEWGAPKTSRAPAPQPEPAPPPTSSPSTSDASILSLKWVGIIGCIAAVAISIGALSAIIVSSDESDSARTPSTDIPTYPTVPPAEERTVSDQTTPNPTATSPVSIRPPDLVQTPDTYQERCGDGYSLSGEGGWATQAGRGSTETSCYFAYSVLKAYWERYPTPSRERRQVIAEGKVDCNPTNAQCAGDKYVMDCQAIGRDPWITCTGGRNARVYVY